MFESLRIAIDQDEDLVNIKIDWGIYKLVHEQP